PSPVKNEEGNASSDAPPWISTKMAAMEQQLAAASAKIASLSSGASKGADTSSTEVDGGSRLAATPGATATQKTARMEEMDRSLKSIVGVQEPMFAIRHPRGRAEEAARAARVERAVASTIARYIAPAGDVATLEEVKVPVSQACRRHQARQMHLGPSTVPDFPDPKLAPAEELREFHGQLGNAAHAEAFEVDLWRHVRKINESIEEWRASKKPR
ncbi:unnamed protein product, partial [Prorocentrum cordatum]